MNTELVLVAIKTCIEEADLDGVEQNLGLLLQANSDAEASEKLAGILVDNYSSYKSEFLAKAMEAIIRRNRNLAIVNHPNNPLFQAAVGTGSIEMYECYIDEGVLPFLALAIQEEHQVHYLELQDVAQEISSELFNVLQKRISGRDYNGAFDTHEGNEGILLIDKQDYEALQNGIEDYNSIIGRRDIIKDLERRAGMD